MRLDHLLLDRMGAKTRLTEELIINRFGNGKIYIDADKIHKFKRAHSKSIRAHELIYCFMGSYSIAKQAKSLAIKISCHPIDDESRAIFGKNGSFPKLLHVTFGA